MAWCILQSPESFRKDSLVSLGLVRKRMPMTIKPLLPISNRNSKVYLMFFLFSIGKMVALYTTFSELHLPLTRHSSLTLQLHNDSLKPCLSTHDISIKFLLWLLMILYKLLVHEQLILIVFLLKNFFQWVISIEMFIYKL